MVLFWIAFCVFPRLTVLIMYLTSGVQGTFPNQTPFWFDFFGVLLAPLLWAAFQLYKAGYPDWAIFGLIVLQVFGWFSAFSGSGSKNK